MSDQRNSSEKYDLFDDLEDGTTINQESLDLIEKENPELFEIIQKSNLLHSNIEKVKPDPFYSRVSQIRVFYQLSETLNPKPKISDRIKFFLANLPYPTLPSFALKPVFTVLVVLILTFSSFIGTAQAADSARPGQFLYPVDLAIEEARLALTFKEESRIKLHLAFAAERLEEAQLEFQEGNYTNAETALLGYEENQNAIRAQIEKNQVQMSEDLINTASEAYKMNRSVLNELLVSAPDESRAVILHAIEVSNEAEEQHFTVQQPGIPEPTATQGNVVIEESPTETEESLSGTPTSPEAEDEIERTEEETQEPTLQPTLVLEEPVWVTVWVHSVNVHAEPNLDEPVTGWLTMDQSYLVSDCENGFAYIQEFSGWASGTCFDPNPCGPAGSCYDLSD